MSLKWTDISGGLLDTLSNLLPGDNPKRAQEERGKGVQAYSAKDFAAASAHFQKAIDSLPNNPQLHSDLGQVYYEMGQLDRAEDSFRKAVAFDPLYLRAVNGLASTLFSRGNFSEAAALYLRSLQLNENDPEVAFNLAASLHNTGRFQEALEFYEQAERIDPRPKYRRNHALALFSLRKLDEALEVLQRGIRDNPDDSELYRLSGRVLEAKGDFEAASASYIKAISLSLRDWRARLDYSRLLDKEQRYEEAAKQADLALQMCKETGDSEGLGVAYWNLGWYYYHLGQLDASIQASQNALSANPKLFGARFNLGLALLCLGRPAEATKEYTQAAEDLSSPADLNYWAITDLETELERSPNLPGGAEILSMLREKYETLKQHRTLA